MPETLPDFAGITGELRPLGLNPAAFHAADDVALVAALESISALRHEVERHQALAAAELARRSRVGFGRRASPGATGTRSTGAMLQSITRSSKRDATEIVDRRAKWSPRRSRGRVRAHAARRPRRRRPCCPTTAPPWFAPLGDAVVSGELTVAVAEAIRCGHRRATAATLTRQCLRAELEALIPLCRDGHADAARRAARQARDRHRRGRGRTRALRHQHEQQFWRVWVKPDGMVRGEFELEPESGHARQGGVRPAHASAADRTEGASRVRRSGARRRRRFADARATRERNAAEGLTQLLHAGASVDPTQRSSTRRSRRSASS